jgi:two-component system, OmpR family, sensor histidine kinase MprB
MRFSRRVVLLSAGAVAAAVLVASFLVYVITRHELRAQVDGSLSQLVLPGPRSVQVKGTLPREPVSGTTAREGPLMLVRRTKAITPSEAATAQVLPAGGGSSQELVAPAAKGDASGGSAGGSNLTLAKGNAHAQVVLPNPKAGEAISYAQFLLSDGSVLHSKLPGFGRGLPVTAATRAVGAGKRGAFFSDVTIAGTAWRELTQRAPDASGLSGVWQVAEPLTQVNRTLGNLKLVLALVCAGGAALAAALGLLVSRAALSPVRRLTGAAEDVARTRDLGHRIDTAEEGELGRLARSFNTMLAALESSRLSQRRLISDASHELRTPLTSVRANLDALAAPGELSEQERAHVVASARAQLRELTVLVEDLVDLSKTGVDAAEIEDVRLDLAAAESLERTRLHAPGCRFVLDAEPCLVRAAPARLDRAIVNLLDNAVKWGPRGGPVEVSVRDGRLRVRDHGPGISTDDLPRVFDRFYRAPEARALPGSGLGLAIVRQLAETHGGAVHAANDPAGGALLTLELPALALTERDLADQAHTLAAESA